VARVVTDAGKYDLPVRGLVEGMQRAAPSPSPARILSWGTTERTHPRRKSSPGMCRDITPQWPFGTVDGQNTSFGRRPPPAYWLGSGIPSHWTCGFTPT